MVDLSQREILRENTSFSFGFDGSQRHLSQTSYKDNQTECFLSVLLNSLGFVCLVVVVVVLCFGGDGGGANISFG